MWTFVSFVSDRLGQVGTEEDLQVSLEVGYSFCGIRSGRYRGLD